MAFLGDEFIQNQVIDLKNDFLIFKGLKVDSALYDQQGITIRIVNDTPALLSCPSPLFKKSVRIDLEIIPPLLIDDFRGIRRGRKNL